MLRRIGKQSGEYVESVLKKERKAVQIQMGRWTGNILPVSWYIMEAVKVREMVTMEWW